ncbi:hypothetical protein [Spirosoma agri]|uniref:Uncharacterized protein n=1 Tax=Spirosoma agri TaxID=1987381 RepID=A0A6M0IKE2_9BACT|nr:hypothetical protein [Spirosoma agri]NEU68302.1 hypothetical protein [Spirosoma agri]
MSTYAVKYYADFVDLPNKGLGIAPVQYRVEFRFRDFTGTPKELSLYKGTPVKISKSSSDQSRFAFWHPLKADFKLRAESFYQSREFYVRSDREVQAVLLSDPSNTGNYARVEFAGWIMPADYSETYKKKPYPIEVSAACGLSTLRDRPIVDRDGKRLQGYVSLSTVIRTALLNTGFDLPLVTGVNIYEQATLRSLSIVNGKVDPAIDPLFTTQIVAEALVNEKNDTLSCYDALKKVLEPYGCRIGQLGGAGGGWLVLRADEAGGGWDVWNQGSKKTVHLRNYSSPDLSAPPDGLSERSVDFGVDIYPGKPVQVLNEKPTVRLLGIKPGVTVEQDFGRYLNWLKSGDWGQVDNTGLATGWTRNNISAADSFRVGVGTEEDQYAMVLYGYGDEKAKPDTPSIRYQVEFAKDSPQYQQAYKRVLRGKFELNLLRASKIVVFAYTQQSNGPLQMHILQKGGAWKESPKTSELVGILTYHCNDAGTITYSGQAEFALEMEAIGNVRFLQVWVCVGEALDKPGGGANPGTPSNRPYLKQYGITLETKQDGVSIDSTQVTITSSKRKLETTASLTLGDVYFPLPYDRTGPLFRLGTHEPTVSWDRADKTGASAVGQGLPYHLAASMARQYMQPADVVEATLLGRLPLGMHTILRYLDIGGIPSEEPATQATNLLVEFKKEIVNAVYPGVYLPWIKVGMTIRVTSDGLNFGDYTVTSIPAFVRNPWYFLVDRTVISQKVSQVTIADASTIKETTFQPYDQQIASRFEWDVQGCRYETSSVRIMHEDVEKLPSPKGFWVEKDGNLIPLNPDEADQPVPPSLPVTTSRHDKFLQDLTSVGIVPKLGATASVSGFVPIEPGKAKLGAIVRQDGITIGELKSTLRRQVTFFTQ